MTCVKVKASGTNIRFTTTRATCPRFLNDRGRGAGGNNKHRVSIAGLRSAVAQVSTFAAIPTFLAVLAFSSLRRVVFGAITAIAIATAIAIIVVKVVNVIVERATLTLVIIVIIVFFLLFFLLLGRWKTEWKEDQDQEQQTRRVDTAQAALVQQSRATTRGQLKQPQRPVAPVVRSSSVLLVTTSSYNNLRLSTVACGHGWRLE